MNQADLQRWSREVAEDPGAPSFVNLARAYRKQGRGDAARSVVLRGLERHPEHVAAHLLLALLHVEAGEREQAGDEWDTVLRLEPDSFEAHRGLGFLSLERGDLAAARRHLDAAARARPDDPSVAQAREVLTRRESRAAASPATPPAAGNGTADPGRLFAELERETPFLGALVLDGQGLVLAGGLRSRDGRGETLGALLGTAVEEARRSVEMLRLTDWTGLLLECEDAALHVAPVGGQVVLVAAAPDAPAGWVVRTSQRAGRIARAFLEGQQ